MNILWKTPIQKIVQCCLISSPHLTDRKKKIWCGLVTWSGCDWNFHALDPRPISPCVNHSAWFKVQNYIAFYRWCHLPALCWFILAAVTHLPFFNPFAGLCFVAPFNLKWEMSPFSRRKHFSNLCLCFHWLTTCSVSCWVGISHHRMLSSLWQSTGCCTFRL